MKARVKATGEIVDVNPTLVYDQATSFGITRYDAGALEILDEPHDPTNWQAYRLNVAKECAAHLLCTNNPEGGWENHEIALMSVDMADTLIARLKEQKGE